MKSLIIIAGVAGLLLLAERALANDSASVTPGAPPVKKDSGHVIAAPVTKETAPHRVSPPPSPKPNLPTDSGRKQGTANIGGSTVAGAHKDGVLNGTEIKRHP